MTKITVETAALIAMLACLPLVSIGSTNDNTPLAVAGALLLAVGLLILTALRFIDLKEDE